MRPRPAVLVLCLGVAAAIAGVVARLVVTDREAVTARVEGAYEAARRGDWPAFEEALAEDVDWGGATRSALVEHVRRLAMMAPPPTWHMRIEDVSVGGDFATVELEAWAGVLQEATEHHPVRVELRKRDGAWKIAKIKETDRSPER